jgi:hypothetical protein
MGFFSGARRKIKKLIPKEVRPFIPYAAALIPGGPFAAGGLGASLGGNQFLKAALARGLTDDEASIKDIARAGIFAAAPTALDTGIGALDSTQGIGKFLTTAGKGKDATSIAEKVSRFADPSGMDAVYAVGGAGAIDAGIKAAELNEDALAKYNAELARQGINDKAGRRAAIRSIYANTGTWDMDEVDGMLDTYGYRTGGRVGYAEGDAVLTERSMVTPEQRNQIEGSQIAEQAFNEIMEKFMNKFPGIATGEETLEEMMAMLQAEKVMEYTGDKMGILGLDRSMDMITPESAGRSAQRIMRGDTRFGSPEFNMGGRVGFEHGGSSHGGSSDDGYITIAERKSKKKKSMDDEEYEEYEDSLKYAKEGYDMLYPEIENQPIRELRLREGGSVDALMERIKELQEEGLDFASAMAQAQKEMKAQSKYAGGIMDVNENINIETPRGDVDMDVNSMESIKGQTAGPQWYYDRIQALEFEFGDELTEEEIAEIAYDSDKFYDKMGYDPAEYKKGGRVNRAEGGMMSATNSSLIDAYEIYKFDMMEQGLEPMSIEEFRDQAMAEGQMASMEAGQEATLEEIYIELLDSGMNPEDAAIKAREIYNGMSSKSSSGRTMAAQGGLMNLGGREMDLRGGGFVPMGAKERADDVPARLSKNEFVMTADAVRAAGGGSIKKGADLMYDQMKQLEGQA